MGAYVQGRKPVEKIAINTGVTNITTGAWVQLTAATTKPLSFMEVYNATTKILVLAIGAAASEVELPIYIYPGIGSQIVPIDQIIPKGSRVSAKAVDANATTGYLLLNMFS